MTYGLDEVETTATKPVHKRWWFWPFVVIGIFIFWAPKSCSAPATTPPPTSTEQSPAPETTSPAPETAADAEPVAEEPQPEPEPEPEAERFTIYTTGRTATVEFDIRDRLTNGLIRSGAQDDTLDAIQQAIAEHPDYEQVSVIGWFPTVDDYGNEERSQILVAYYTRETIEKINFNNPAQVDIFKIRDSGTVHPNLEP